MKLTLQISCCTAVIVFCHLIVCVRPIEHPPHQPVRHHLQVIAYPKHNTLYAGDTVVVKCVVNGGPRQEHFPRVGLYLQLDQSTVVPINSDIPGISLQTVAAPGSNGKYGRYSKSTTYVTIGHEMYDVLRHMENYFFCAVSTTAGENQVDYFTVWKVPYST